ncbi:MAG TPA: large conductance mechanosensitive channel protein MscL [Ktedonobacteraceae bacterium]
MSSGTYDPEATIIKTKTKGTTSETESSTGESELEEIIVKDVTKITKGVFKSLEGFRSFILRGNAVDLAIGIVIGAAFTSVVTSLVGDVITPLIPLPGKNSLGILDISLPSFYPKGSTIHIGNFLNALISFLIVAAVLYFFVVQPVNSLMKLYHGKEAEKPSTRECPYCFQAVNVKATRCPYCTSLVPLDKAAKKAEDEVVLILPESLEKLSDKLAESIVRKATTALEKSPEGSVTDETPHSEG